MSKKILLLTNIYPSDDLPKGYTPIVHYFAKEWVKMGYDVRVIDYDVNFPQIYYRLTSKFNKFLASFAGTVVKTHAVYDKIYSLEGVKVYRIALTKYIPHTLYSKKQIKKAIKKSIVFCKDEIYKPDIIISHWANPCLEIMRTLKEQYNVPTCYICHIYNAIDVYGKKIPEIFSTIDVIGFRSEYIKKQFIEKYRISKPNFLCYSGIPTKFLLNNPQRNFKNIQKFLYVGTLIKRKHPISILYALKKTYRNDYFFMNYIGEGNESQYLKNVSVKLGIESKIRLQGRVSREEIIKALDWCDVFVMISSNETFGLVYLEAMARGCITIASRKEGFDGIIKDGYNGFLCEAGNAEELAEIFNVIKNMPKENLQMISTNARTTAKELTDFKAANRYIESVIRLSESKTD